MPHFSKTVFMLVGLFVSSESVFAQAPPTGDVRLVFPQFVDSGGVVATIMLVNQSFTEPCSGTLETFDHLGNRLPVSIGGTVSSQHDFTLPAGGSRFFRTDLSQETMTLGSARARADRPIAGSIAFSGATGPAGFAAARPFHRAVLPVEQDPTTQTRTAMAITVVGNDPAVVNLTARGPDGSELANGKATVEVNGHGQKAVFVDEAIPALAGSSLQGSVEIQSSRLLSGIGAHSSGFRLSAIPVQPLGQDALFSFEGGLLGWQPLAIDVNDGGSVAQWSIQPSSDRSADGGQSLKLFLDNLTDAGKVWIQRAFAVEPNTRYRVGIRYSLATNEYGDFNVWRIIAGALAQPPKTRDELPYQGNSGHGGPNDIGYVWVEKAYEQELESGPDGLLYVVVGVWGTWETPRTYYIDDLWVSLEEVP